MEYYFFPALNSKSSSPTIKDYVKTLAELTSLMESFLTRSYPPINLLISYSKLNQTSVHMNLTFHDVFCLEDN